MNIDFNNSSSIALINATYYDSLGAYNQTGLWRNFQVLPATNKTKASNNRVSIIFGSKHDGNKVKKPIKVFSVPIIDKTPTTAKPNNKNGTSNKKTGPKKSFDDTISEEHSVEYEYEEIGGWGGHDFGYGSTHGHGIKKKIKKPSKIKFPSYSHLSKGKPMRSCKSRKKIMHRLKKMGKYMIPAGLGFLAFKLVLLPILFKVIALMSAKGLLLALVSFIMASLLSLKQIVGSQARTDTRKDITLVPIPVHSISHKHKLHKNDIEYVEYDHNPYNAYSETDRNGVVKNFSNRASRIVST